MTDDRDAQLYQLHEELKKLKTDYDRLARITATYYKSLCSARAEAAGRKAYAEKLKARIAELSQ